MKKLVLFLGVLISATSFAASYLEMAAPAHGEMACTLINDMPDPTLHVSVTTTNSGSGMQDFVINNVLTGQSQAGYIILVKNTATSAIIHITTRGGSSFVDTQLESVEVLPGRPSSEGKVWALEVFSQANIGRLYCASTPK